jgi:hypothetical protein
LPGRQLQCKCREGSFPRQRSAASLVRDDRGSVHCRRAGQRPAVCSGCKPDPLPGRRLHSNLPGGDKSGRADGTWSRADFEWDAENNQYFCPEGEALKQFRRNYSDPNRGPDGKGVAKYQALKLTCQACPSKLKCCPNADTRKITREEHEDARQVKYPFSLDFSQNSCGLLHRIAVS